MKESLNICILMSSILTSIQIYSEGFCLVRKTISAYDKVKEVDTYESRYFETDSNRSKGDVS